jgi:hypothetical protein
MAVNDAATPSQLCPGMRNHIIDIVHPPGICIPPIAAIAVHQAIVADVLATKSSVAMPTNAR